MSWWPSVVSMPSCSSAGFGVLGRQRCGLDAAEPVAQVDRRQAEDAYSPGGAYSPGSRALAAYIRGSVNLSSPVAQGVDMSEGDVGAGSRYEAPVADWAGLIKGTQDKVAKYLVKERARQRWLLNLAILAGALSTALTASPALGGRPFRTGWRDLRPHLTRLADLVRRRRHLLRRCDLNSAAEIHNIDERVVRAEGERPDSKSSMSAGSLGS